MDFSKAKKKESLHNDLLYITIAIDYLHPCKENERDILQFKAKCKTHLDTRYWDSDSSIHDIIDQLERKGLVDIGNYIILKDIVCFNKKIIREIKKTELALQALGVCISREENDDGKDGELAVRVKIDEESTECQIDEKFKEFIRKISGNICDKINENYDCDGFDEFNKRWKLHDLRTLESVEFIRYLHQGNCENFQRLLQKCLSKSEEHMFTTDEGFYRNIGQWRTVNDALLRENYVEEIFEKLGGSMQSALKGSIFIFVRFSNIENLRNFQDYYEHRHLERDFRKLFYEGQTGNQGKLIVEINKENIRRHKLFIESSNPDHFLLNSRKRLQSFEAERFFPLYQAETITHVCEILQTHSCVFITFESSHNMPMISNQILSKFTHNDRDFIPVFNSSLFEVWKIIDNIDNFVILSCTPSKYDLYDEEQLSSFFLQLEKRLKRGIIKFKIILTIDTRFISNVIPHFIRYDIALGTQLIDIESIHISAEKIHGIAVKVLQRYNTELSNDRNQSLFKECKEEIDYGQKEAKIEKLFHERSDDAIALTILFLRNGQYSYESDCEEINTVVTKHFDRDDRISPTSLSISAAKLLHGNILRWDDFESKLCFSNAVLAHCVIKNAIKSGFEAMLIDTAQLRQLDVLDSSGIFKSVSACKSLILRIENELQFASPEYVREIFNLKIWENKIFQDALMMETEEAVSFYHCLQSLDSRINNKLIEILISNGSIFLLKYITHELKVNDRRLLSYFSAGIKSGSVKMCKYLIENFKKEFDLISNTLTPFVLIAVETKSLQMLQFFQTYISIFDVSALFLAVRLGTIQIVEYLVRSGIDISSRDENQQTLLHIASNVDDPQLFSFTIRIAPHLINEQDATGRFPLYYAAESGFVSHVVLLLQCDNTNWSLKTIDNECLLHASVRSLSKSMVCYIVQKMPDELFAEQFLLKNRLGYTPLDLAVYLADRQIVECIILRSTALEIITYDEWLTSASIQSYFSQSLSVSSTPCFGLLFCLLFGFMRRISDTFKFNSNVCSVERWFAFSHEYRIYPQYQRKLEEINKLCTILLEAYANFLPDLLNTRDPHGMTPLSFAVCCDAETIIRNFIEKGADYCCFSHDGSTLLHFCLNYGSLDLIKVFPYFPDWYLNAYDEKGFHSVDLLIKRSREDMEIFFEYFCIERFHLQDENGDSIFHRLARCDVATELGIIESPIIDQWIFLSKVICDKFPSLINCINKNGDPPLWDLVVYGKEDVVKQFLSLGADIYQECSNGRSLFHAAVLSKSISMLKLIVSQAVDIIDKPDLKGVTPIMLAVSMNLIDIVSVLIENDCNLRKTDAKGMDAFDIAFDTENIECARMIMRASPDINRRKPVDRLARAISSNSDEMKILLEFRYGIDSRDHNGETILHTAIKQKCKEAFILILKIPDEENYQPNDDFGISKIYCCEKELVQQPFIGISYLLNVPTLNENKSPIFICLESGFNDGYHTLKESKADLNIRTYKKETVIHAAIVGVTEKELDFNILTELLKECPKGMVNEPDIYDITPLFMRESLMNDKIPKCLLRYNADFQRKTKHRETIIHLLLKYGNSDFIDCFLEEDHKLAFEEDGNGNSPLHLILSQYKTNISNLLTDLCRDNPVYIRKHGIKICMLALQNRRLDTLIKMFKHTLNENDAKSLEPLIGNVLMLKSGWALENCIQMAVENGNLNIIKRMLVTGKIDSVDDDGNTLLYYAVRSKSSKVLMYLHHCAPYLISVKNKKGLSVLAMSLIEGNISCLAQLLRITKITEYKNIVYKAVIYLNSKLFLEVLQTLKKNLPSETFRRIRDFQQNAPCLEAIKRGDIEKLKLMKEFGAEVSHRANRSKYMNALRASVMSDNLLMVETVIEYLDSNDSCKDGKIDELNERLHNGETPLFTAFKLKESNIAKLLLNQDPYICVKTDDGSTLLHAAIAHCHPDLAERLCKIDLSLLIEPDHQGKTPLDHALLSENKEMIKTVALLSEKYHFSSMYLFEKFERTIKNRELTEEELPMLMKNDYPLHLLQNHAKHSILHICVLHENLRALEIILYTSKNNSKLLNLKDETGMTVLYDFVSKGNYDFVKLCLSHGSDPNISKLTCVREVTKLWFTTLQTELKFPLQVAVNNRDFPMSKLLIDFGADTKIKGGNGENLLFLAIANRDTEMCKLLIETDKSLAHGIYRNFITPHVFEFLLHGNDNQVVMKRSSLRQQILLLCKIFHFETIRHITTDFRITDIIYVLFPILIILSLLDSSIFIILVGIISFLFVRKPCKHILPWCLFYIIIFLILFVNFFYIRNIFYVRNQYETDFFRYYRHLRYSNLYFF